MSNNKSKSTGLRFIWIPGRKKHQPKGRYDTTNKQIVHGHHQQKKNEPWSLGGSKGHEELLKSSDVATEAANHSVSAAASAALPAASALGATVVNHSSSTEHLNGSAAKDVAGTDGGCSDEGAHSIATMPARQKCNGAIKKFPLNSSGDGFGGMINENASPASAPPAHFVPLYSPHVLDLPDIPWNLLDRGGDSVLMYSSRFQKDLDSIEKCDAIDDVDATRLVYLDTKNMTCGYGDNKRPLTSKQRRNEADDGDKEDKGVRCLYYALQCCECTIS